MFDLDTLSSVCFTENLATYSSSGRDIGEMVVSVEEVTRGGEVCYLVHACSEGLVGGLPCGTSITAYLNRHMQTLEQTQHEYVKVPNKPFDKKTLIIKAGVDYVLRSIFTQGEKVSVTEKSFPQSSMEMFMSEGANILSQRCFVRLNTIPDNIQFQSFDSNYHLCKSTYTRLPEKKVHSADEVPVRGIEFIVYSPMLGNEVWQSYFLANGSLSYRVNVCSGVTMRMVAPSVRLPKDESKAMMPFVSLSEDMMLVSSFLEKKEESFQSNMNYTRRNPELRALLHDFLQFLLLRKPDSTLNFAADYFTALSTRIPSPDSNPTPVEGKLVQ